MNKIRNGIPLRPGVQRVTSRGYNKAGLLAQQARSGDSASRNGRAVYLRSIIFLTLLKLPAEMR